MSEIDPLRHKMVALVDSRIVKFVFDEMIPVPPAPAGFSEQQAIDYLTINVPVVRGHYEPTEKFAEWAKEHNFEYSFIPGKTFDETYLQAENYTDFFFFKLSW